MTITFAGHSFIPERNKVKEMVREKIENNIIDAEKVICYIGGYGEFDDICSCVCRELKKKYNCIEIVYVTPYINLSEQAKIKEMQEYGLFDASIYPPIEKVPPKFAISKRNEWMMENADLIIAYVDHNYGGAYKSLQVARRRKKRIINICAICY